MFLFVFSLLSFGYVEKSTAQYIDFSHCNGSQKKEGFCVTCMAAPSDDSGYNVDSGDPPPLTGGGNGAPKISLIYCVKPDKSLPDADINGCVGGHFTSHSIYASGIYNYIRDQDVAHCLTMAPPNSSSSCEMLNRASCNAVGKRDCIWFGNLNQCARSINGVGNSICKDGAKKSFPAAEMSSLNEMISSPYWFKKTTSIPDSFCEIKPDLHVSGVSYGRYRNRLSYKYYTLSGEGPYEVKDGKVNYNGKVYDTTPGVYLVEISGFVLFEEFNETFSVYIEDKSLQPIYGSGERFENLGGSSKGYGINISNSNYPGSVTNPYK